MDMTLHHQNFMLAVRRHIGLPDFKPANDSVALLTGRPTDIAVGTELARIADRVQKDAIYTGWRSLTATEPASFTIAYREFLTVDVIDRVVPFAANDEMPIIFVSTRADEFFGIDRRGSLVRVPGKPKAVARGRMLAMKRIKAAAEAMGDTLLETKRWAAPGAGWIEPEQAVETIVRFA